jgi:hypothetical protein
VNQEEANLYWADRHFKKFVVVLERGPKRKPEREVKYVAARNGSTAIATARANAFHVKSPSRVSCRLATAFDLGCVATQPMSANV